MAHLSVIVPTHDTRELTVRCIEAVVAGGEGRLAGGPPEVIVVDDASTDGTEEALRERFPHVQVERLSSRSGFTVAANRGLACASGEILLLLNSDTVVEPGALAALECCLAEHRELGVVGAQLLDPDGSPQWSGGLEPSLAWLFVLAADLGPLLNRLPGYRRRRPLLAADVRRVDWVTGAALALRRSVWDEVGSLDEGFSFYGQDLDYCCRVQRAGWGVAIDPRVRVVHLRGATIGAAETTADSKSLALLFSDLLLWAGHHRGPSWTAAARAALLAGAWLRWRRVWRLGVGSRAARRVARAELDATREALGAVKGGTSPDVLGKGPSAIEVEDDSHRKGTARGPVERGEP